MHSFILILESLRERPPKYEEFCAKGDQVRGLGVNFFLEKVYPNSQQIAKESVHMMLCAYAFVMYPDRTHKGPINKMTAQHTTTQAQSLIRTMLVMERADEQLRLALSVLNDPITIDHNWLKEHRQCVVMCLKLFQGSFAIWRRADLPHAICRLEEAGNGKSELVQKYFRWLEKEVGNEQAVVMLREARMARVAVQGAGTGSRVM